MNNSFSNGLVTGIQLRIMWSGIAVLCFFGIFQMHFDNPFKFYNSSARLVGVYLYYVQSYSSPKPFVEVPDIKFTPIFSKLEDNTVSLLTWTILTTLALMFMYSSFVKQKLSIIQRRIALAAIIAFSLITAFPFQMEGYRSECVKLIPIFTYSYEFADYSSYFAICGVVVLVISVAAMMTVGMGRANQNNIEQGDASVQYNLGVCYANGTGVEQNYIKAVGYYQQAAEQGFAEAQYDLAVCYTKGQGVEQNDTEALKWFQKAAEQGHKKAIALLKEIEPNRSDSDLET